MKTSSKRAAFMITLALFTLASCSDDLAPVQPGSVMERTDMVIEGDMDLQDYRQVAEDDPTTDLITYNYYGNPSQDFDFIINLANGYRLKISVHDAERLNPWQQVEQPYNIYPTSDLEDKLSYTKVELVTQQNEPVYATNPNSNTPPGIELGAFRVTEYSDQTIQCRMRDMTLYHASGADRTITINGTFVGAVTFE